ncbi:MAG: thioredoxin family protein [Alphaproteobacteria bacterium]|nr:thioredoxin family protein [Alphaproteobacteria bacterium]
MNTIENGLLAVVKQDCETCVLIEPVLALLAADGMAVYSQDNPGFPASIASVLDDRELETSFNLEIETVPTLVRFEDGTETGRLVGWVRDEWQDFTGIGDLGQDLPAFRPGCGSKSVEPGIAEELAVRYGDLAINARRIEVAPLEDEIEACFEREWSDGLPVVPPTPTRVYRMLQGTTRPPEEVIGIIPPDLAPCTVEKVAINAVMAGCKPEYLPVVLAAVEAALIDEFCMHGLLCTTMFAGPMVVVNGPIAQRIGMNARENALGQGNRANATIGRALQLVIRNVGGGKPGGIDRACMGNPGKYTFCFAEDEAGSNWESLAVERGFAPDASTVTLFAGDGVQAVADQKSRTPESLARTLAACLRVVDHPKMVMAGDAFLIVSPEHERVFHQAGWSKARLKEELHELLMIPGAELAAGAGGIAEGLPAKMADQTLPKFRPGGLNIVRAGGGAGMFSAVIGGWAATGEIGSIPVTKEITS